jgi:branched-chain amino acid transport system permease protein
VIARLVEGVPKRALVLLALFALAALFAPAFVGDYLLTVFIMGCYFAFTGQAWNIMMGFAGQLSLGHALYVGLGAYTTAILFVRYGVPPWAGLFVAVPIAMAVGGVMGFLAFRFRVGGVYFAILTIAFAEFARIGFDHFTWVNGSAGLFLPVAQYTHNDLWRLRGSPTMFYYVMLAATALAFLACRVLLKSRLGYYWLAIREDEQAARAVGINAFRYKMIAVVISAGMTSFAGVFYAFFYNNLFPEQIFNISRSIEIILAPLVGGMGTLFGPIFGTFILEGLSEGLRVLLAKFGIDIPGIKHVFFGIVLLIVVIARPEGVWPRVARKLGLEERAK